jgi:hypothetical protein
MKLLLKFLACLTVVLWIFGCSERPNVVIEKSLTNSLGGSNCVLGSKLRDWTNTLGRPSVVQQRDGANTFFYWPEKGVGVFCHPLFQGQYRLRKEPEWIVTSIFIPLLTNLHPRIPPVAEETRINFRTLAVQSKAFDEEKLKNLRDVELYYNDGKLEAIEIRKPDSLLGDYD